MDALTPEQVAELSEALRSLDESIRTDLDAAREAARPVELDQARVGRVSRIDAIQQQQMAAASRDAKKHRLALIAQALARIDADEYGLCLRCEEPIARKRLYARPEAALCVGCAGRGAR